MSGWPARVALLCVLVLAPLVAGADARAGLRAGMSRALQAEGITGAVWATLDEAGRVQADAAGNAARNRPMRPDDRVHVGSIAKSMLATGVLRLVSEGRLDLDAPVDQLLPGLAFDNRWGATDPVRLRHLLDHTAGLDDMRLWQFFSLRPTPDTPLAEATDSDRPLKVRSRPGSRFSYSNTGYALLGRVIEQVTGERYERYLDAHLLAPLGMRDSTFGFTTQQGANADPRLAMGHYENGVAQPATPLFLRPAAQFTTTSADMLRFGAFLMGDGRIAGEPFIDPGLMRARGHAAGTEAARAGLRVGYALGLSLRDRHGAVGLCHGGDTVGFRAMLCVYPEQRRAFFVAFNADVEGADYAGIRGRLVETLGVATPGVPRRTPPRTDLRQWAGFYVPSPNRFASFAWLDTVFGFVHLAPADAGLQLRSVQSPAVLLTPTPSGLFREPDRVLPSHALLVASDGTRVLVNDRQSYARIATVRLAALWTSLLAAVLGLFYIVAIGLWRLLRRRRWRDDALRAPSFVLAALAIPAMLMLRQSFLAMGDVSPGSIALAVVTSLLPVALLVGMGQAVGMKPRAARGDAFAMLALLQGWVVLAAWGLMPARMWAM